MKQAKQGVSMECLKNFRQECKDALIAMKRKIVAIPALSSPFLRWCGSLTPEVVASGDTTRSSKLMSVALTELIKLKWIEGDADQLLRQFTELIRRHTVQDQQCFHTCAVPRSLRGFAKCCAAAHFFR